MATDSEASPFGRAALVCIAALAFYFFAFFPAMSCVARHHLPSGIIYAWMPLPVPVLQRMERLWGEVDPEGEARMHEILF
jgi:hypothetical protein